MKTTILRNRPTASAALRHRGAPTSEAKRSRRKFLQFFPDGFYDETYLDFERNYKWEAHLRWKKFLDRPVFRALLRDHRYQQIAKTAIAIESRTNLLFSFEKMALRDAVRSPRGARAFATGLYNWLYGSGDEKLRFERWCAAVGNLPRRQTRVLTWPAVTVFGFLARPQQYLFLKPNVTRIAARAYGFNFQYESRPNWATYQSYREFALQVRRDNRDLKPRDMIDLQSFIWVLGSDEY